MADSSKGNKSVLAAAALTGAAALATGGLAGIAIAVAGAAAAAGILTATNKDKKGK